MSFKPHMTGQNPVENEGVSPTCAFLCQKLSRAPDKRKIFVPVIGLQAGRFVLK